jgi:hypothetical protein
MIQLGYTGTRDGMTRPQILGIHQHIAHTFLIPAFPAVQAHFGDCEGGDHEFFVIATVLGCRTIAHPPANTALRAFCPADEIREPKDYLARDRDIAAEGSAGLLAAPKTPRPVFRSGTWTTVGYALDLGTPVTVFLPSGQAVPGIEFATELRGARR